MKRLAIFGLVLLIYGISVFGGFIQDDTKVIADDPEMGQVSPLLSAFTRPYYYNDAGGHAGAYRPLTSFSLYLNALITGKGSWGFRLVNVLMYGGVCLLIYGFLKRFTAEKTAFWGTVIFLVLPIHAEDVNNVVGRAEMLSLGFVLLGVLVQFKKKWELSALMLLLALLSKETAMVGVPILGYLMIISKENKETKAGVISYYALVMIFYLILRGIVLGAEGMLNNATIVENPLKFVDTGVRVMNAFALIPFGIGKAIFPLRLSYDYSFNQLKMITSWFDWRVLLGISLMVLSLGSLFTKLRKNSLWILGQAFFWGSIVITGNILFPVGTIFGERLWFWPSLGIIFIVATLLSFHPHSLLATDNSDSPAESDHLDSRLEFPLRGTKQFKSAKRGTKNKGCKAIVFSSMTILLIAYAGRTFVRNIDWLSQDRLFVHDVSYAEDSVMTQTNASAMYLLKQDFSHALVYLEKAEAIYPKYTVLLNNWGMYYFWTGNKEKAKEKFEECLSIEPVYDLCRFNIELVK